MFSQLGQKQDHCPRRAKEENQFIDQSRFDAAMIGGDSPFSAALVPRGPIDKQFSWWQTGAASSGEQLYISGRDVYDVLVALI